MSVIFVAIVVLGLLGLANLFLSFGIIRRLRIHTAELELLRVDGPPPGQTMLQPGQSVPEFQAVTIEGHQIGRALFTSSTFVAFVTPDCQGCSERLPDFIAAAAAYPGGRERVLAVIAASDETAAEPYVAQLRDVAQVVVDTEEAVVRAFKVRLFPSFAVVSAGGRIEESDPRLKAMSPSPAR